MIAEPFLPDGTALPHAIPDGPLDRLRAAGVLRDVDVHFARVAGRLAAESDPLVLLGMAAASRAPGAGHACVELARPDRLVRAEPGARGREAPAVAWPDATAWRAALTASTAVATPAEFAAGGRRPLVLDGDRLYLARHWEYERRLVGALAARAGRTCDGVDETALAAGLDRLFPPGPHDATDGVHGGQRAAATTAVRRHLAVITGGPGTGKTTTVCRVLALLAEQAIARGEAPPRIVLAAPTGKAAARLAESVCAGIAALALAAAVAAAIPRVATTLHRLLGWQPRTPTRFRHGADLPLPADVVVVDEASMVDLALMAKLVDAVAPDARLVLLGDHDQLASVEAGSVLADLCGGDAASRAPTNMPNVPSNGTPPVAACVVRLTRSYRFDGRGAIGRLAAAVNAGDADAALAILRGGPAGGDDGSGTDEVAFVELADGRAGEAQAARLCARSAGAYARAARSSGPHAALDAFDALRILAAHRGGAWGVGGLNDVVVRHLAGTGDLPPDAGARPWYHGQPVLVTENDPTVELFNGDVGVVLADGDGRSLRAWFRSGSAGGVRGVAPARLPAHETVYAMTVHKSQGSQFDAVVLVLPPRPSPVLTRELLYTGVSRARRRVTVVGSEATLRAGIADRVQRAGGVRDALWGVEGVM